MNLVWVVVVTLAMAGDRQAGTEASGHNASSAHDDCREADRDRDYAALAGRCGDCVEVAGDDRERRFCEGRVSWIYERSDTDGGWSGLRRLDDLRRSDELAPGLQLMQSTDVSGTVRVEAAIWALSVADRVGARELAEQIVDDISPLAASVSLPVQRRFDSLRSQALAHAGRDAEAREVAAALTPRGGPTVVDRIAVERHRRGRGPWVAVLLVIWAVITVPTAVRHRSSRTVAQTPALTGLIPLWALTLCTGLLVWLWSAPDPEEGPSVHQLAELVLLGASWSLVHVTTAYAVETRHRWLRRVIRALSASSTLGLAYLCLWYMGELDWVGL